MTEHSTHAERIKTNFLVMLLLLSITEQQSGLN